MSLDSRMAVTMRESGSTSGPPARSCRNQPDRSCVRRVGALQSEAVASPRESRIPPSEGTRPTKGREARSVVDGGRQDSSLARLLVLSRGGRTGGSLPIYRSARYRFAPTGREHDRSVVGNGEGEGTMKDDDSVQAAVGPTRPRAPSIARGIPAGEPTTACRGAGALLGQGSRVAGCARIERAIRQFARCGCCTARGGRSCRVGSARPGTSRLECRPSPSFGNCLRESGHVRVFYR